jgi:hypothetical protein
MARKHDADHRAEGKKGYHTFGNGDEYGIGNHLVASSAASGDRCGSASATSGAGAREKLVLVFARIGGQRHSETGGADQRDDQKLPFGITRLGLSR